MATLEERFDILAEDYTTAIQQVVTKLDEHTSTQRDLGRDIREVSRDVREQGRDMREVRQRLVAVETHLATVDTRLNRIDERLESLGTESKETHSKLDQVIALLSQASKGDA